MLFIPTAASCGVLRLKIKLGEYGSDLPFPRARAPEYRAERGRAYLLSSERVQELPRRSGRHIRFEGPESNRIWTKLQPWLQFLRLIVHIFRFAIPDFARV